MPHLDYPSLAFYAPSHMHNFMTVMLAIDDMTEGISLFPLRGWWAERC